MHQCCERSSHCFLQGKEPSSDKPKNWGSGLKDRDIREEKYDPLRGGRKLWTEIYKELSALLLEEVVVRCLMGKCFRSLHARKLPGNSHFLCSSFTLIFSPVSSSFPPNIHLNSWAPSSGLGLPIYPF